MPKTFTPRIPRPTVTLPVYETWMVVYLNAAGILVEGTVKCRKGSFIAACRKQLGVEIIDTTWDRELLSN